ncbi:MAG: hypothetical protein EBR53_04275 [Actinobacteria bacterium]|jgi:hypothetical protein|nr:hypothetical protein [Actinomycetota bacterium]
MAHFAEIDENNIVQRVLVVDNSLEHRGADFLANDLGLGGNWIQTSYNNNFRKQYAGIGFFYDFVNDVFIAPQPYESWSLDENFDWQPPISMPRNGLWSWDESSLSWIEVKI